MKKLLSLIFVFSIYSYASLIGSNFTQRDLQILEDLDINSSFITDYKLQEVYEQFQNRRNSHNYVEKLNEASLFVPRVKDILKQKNIPDVFIYMAMAESNFDIDAKSYARATGLWQFMHGTAKRYGLKNDFYVDERMDLVKSTIAATKYLNALHDRFGKWYLAAIAYNCGEGRVVEAITRSILDSYVEKHPSQRRSKKIYEFRKTISLYQQRREPFYKLRRVYNEVKTWGIEPSIDDLLHEQKGLERQYLPKESRRYIRKIISLAMLNSQNFIKNDVNSHLLNIGISKTIATVPVKGGWHLNNIAKAIGMKYEELYELNKHLKRGIVPPSEKFYTINIPYSRLSRFNLNKHSIKDTVYAVHTVRSGDTLIGIARKYNITVSMIKKQNKLKSSFLSLRQKLVLPIPNDMIKNRNIFKLDNRVTKKRHTVKSGDSLYSIARKYKVDVKKIMRDNNLKSSFLKIGDRLVIR